MNITNTKPIKTDTTTILLLTIIMIIIVASAIATVTIIVTGWTYSYINMYRFDSSVLKPYGIIWKIYD